MQPTDRPTDRTNEWAREREPALEREYRWTLHEFVYEGEKIPQFSSTFFNVHCHFFHSNETKAIKSAKKEREKTLSSATSTNAVSHNRIMVVVWCAVFFVLRNAKKQCEKLSAFVINIFFSSCWVFCLHVQWKKIEGDWTRGLALRCNAKSKLWK